MAIPTNKQELQKEINISYAKLQEELSSIPPELASIADLEGHSRGTLMSMNNLVAYLIGWGELVLKWNRKTDNNELCDFPETGYKWNELGKLAQKFYKDYEGKDYVGLLKRLEQTVNEILLMIDKKTDEELYRVDWYGKWTQGRMIQFNTSSPYKNATGRIRKWKKMLYSAHR